MKEREKSAEGWPCRRFKKWPLAPAWTPEPVKKRVSAIGYQKVVGAVRSLYNDPAMSESLAKLQDYCFQQGGMSNANPRDRIFFHDILCHDLTFFEGDKGRPLVEDLPLDPKVYDAFPQMKASHYDLIRVTSRGIVGGLKGHRLLLDKAVKCGARVFRGPKVGEVVLGRVVQIGRGFFLDEPFLRVPEAMVDALVEVFEAEHAACSAKFKGLSKESLLKVAGYHLYEEVAGRLLQAQFEEATPEGLGFEPRLVRFKARKRRELPDLSSLEDAEVIEEEGGKATLVMVRQTQDRRTHLAIQKAMITVDDRELLFLTFLVEGRDEIEAQLKEALPNHVKREAEVLTPLATYRTLRHSVKAG